MAHFRATIQGERGEASRLGNKRTGMVVTCNSWTVGVKVYASHENGKDVFDVYATSGSTKDGNDQPVARISRDDHGVTVENLN